VVHFDAHADLRNRYQGISWSHACTLRRIRELNLETISLGIRSMSHKGARLVESESIRQIMPESLTFLQEAHREIERLSGPAWITFDVDSLDPSIMPATGTPEPGGLSWQQTMHLFQLLRDSKIQICGADIVELAPIKNLCFPDFLAVKLTHRLLLAFA